MIVALFAIMMIFFGIIGGIIGAAGSQEKVKVSDNSVLKIELKGALVENAEEDPFALDLSEIFPAAGNTEKVGLFQTIEAIHYAAQDDKISGIYLDMFAFESGGWASLKSIREALEQFKASGKFIYAYSEFYTEKTYYLASLADSIYMPPTGMMEFNGLVADRMFYTGLFEKLEIKPLVFRVGTYKSAVEPYFAKEMSPASKEQTEVFLGDMWSTFTSAVSASRGLSVPVIDELANTLVYADGEKPLEAGLIDRLAYEDEVLAVLRSKCGLEKDDKIKFVPLKKYTQLAMEKAKKSSSKVAVVFVEGTIQFGKSGEGAAGSESVVAALRKAREDENVKAVVLRVNSPGGISIAADLMAREVRETGKTKPIIASMGDYAASGGYYISAGADKIFAQENTITGSIGIFRILYDAQAMFNNKLGITFDQAETHAHANIGTPFHHMSAVDSAFWQKSTEEGYWEFIDIVKDGRKFPNREAVDKIAQGRVWTGLEAKNIQLVDEYGDLRDAIAEAASQAGLGDDYEVARLPKIETPFEQIMKSMSESAQSHSDLAVFRSEIEALKRLKQTFPASNAAYALMPYGLEVH